MGLMLKQSTAATVLIGPFVDEDDGKTAETGLTLTQADIRLSKNGGNMAQKNQADAATHDEIGYYSCSLDTTDTNTLGRLQLMVHESGALPVYHEYMVVTAEVYDTNCSTDHFTVDLTSTATGDIWDEASAGHVGADTYGKYVSDIIADTNELQGDWTNGGRLDTIIDSLALEATVAALNDIDADTVWDEVMDTNAPANADTARKIINILSSVLAGKSSGGGTATIVFRDTGDTKNRISATVDANGNRTAVGTVDGT